MDGEVPTGLPQENTRGDDATEGAFLPTGCALHVEHLQEVRKALRGQLRELEDQNRRLRRQLGQCRSSASKRARLRTESELAVRESVEAVNKIVATLEGDTLVTGSPRYEDEEDTTS